MGKSLSVRERHWVAGLLEGEGCFSRCRTSPQVSMTQAGSTELLVRLQEMFGGSVSKIRPSGTAKQLLINKIIKRTKPRFDWRCYGDNARNVMSQVYRLMSKRRKTQINRVMQGDPEWARA